MAIDKKSSYYDQGGIETIKIIKAKLTPEQYQGYLLGNIIKYSTRLNWKGSPERDAEKLVVYSKQLQERNEVVQEPKVFDWVPYKPDDLYGQWDMFTDKVGEPEVVVNGKKVEDAWQPADDSGYWCNTKLSFRLTPVQQEAYEGAKWVYFSGRRSGKSTLLAYIFLEECCKVYGAWLVLPEFRSKGFMDTIRYVWERWPEFRKEDMVLETKENGIRITRN